DLRSRPLGPDVPDARGSGGEGQQHAVRALRRHLDGEGLEHPVDGRADARRGRVGQHLQPLRSVVTVRGLQGIRFWPRRRETRSRAVLEIRMNTQMSAQQVSGPPPVGFFKRFFLLIVLIVGLGAMLAAVLGGAYLVETYLLGA